MRFRYLLIPALIAMTAPVASAAEIGPLPEKGFQVVWQADLKLTGGVRGVHVTDDLVFVYTKDNYVGLVKRENGTRPLRLHPVPAGDRMGLPVVMKETLIFPAQASLEIYDMTGKFLRSQKLRASLRSDAVGEDNVIYAGVDAELGGRIAAIETTVAAMDTRAVWERQPRSGVSARPALVGGMLFIGSRDGRIYGLSADYGKPIWPRLRDTEFGFQTGREILADLAADNTGVYAASMDSKLYCLDFNTGRLRWEYYAGQELNTASAPVPTKDTVFMYVPNKGVVAIDKGEVGPIARPKWVATDAVQFLAQEGNMVYLLSGDNRIIAVEAPPAEKANNLRPADAQRAAEGREPLVRFTSSRRDFAAFATNPKDGMVYACTNSGVLYALKAITKPGEIGQQAAAPAAEGPAVAAGR